jgi:hypothetical protein
MVKNVCVNWTGFFCFTCEMRNRKGPFLFCFAGLDTLLESDWIASHSLSQYSIQHCLELDLAANPRPVSIVDITGQPK